MKELWTEILFIDRKTCETWSTYYIGAFREVIEALAERHAHDPSVDFEVVDCFIVD